MKYTVLVLCCVSLQAFGAGVLGDGEGVADQKRRVMPAKSLLTEDSVKLPYLQNKFVRLSPAALVRHQEMKIVTKYLKSKKSRKLVWGYVPGDKYFEHLLSQSLSAYVHKEFQMDLTGIPLLRMRHLIVMRLKRSPLTRFNFKFS